MVVEKGNAMAVVRNRRRQFSRYQGLNLSILDLDRKIERKKVKEENEKSKLYFYFKFNNYYF